MWAAAAPLWFDDVASGVAVRADPHHAVHISLAPRCDFLRAAPEARRACITAPSMSAGMHIEPSRRNMESSSVTNWEATRRPRWGHVTPLMITPQRVIRA